MTTCKQNEFDLKRENSGIMYGIIDMRDNSCG